MLGFVLLSIVMITGALGVITLRQPVHAALSLVATLLTLAITYVTLQAHFLAAIQVIVYAGAIMVLFLFVIMLLNVQGEERSDTFGWLRPAAYAVAALAAIGIITVTFMNPSRPLEPELVAAALGGGGPAEVGAALFSEFVLAFQLVGVLLLTGIVGAVSLVQRKAEEVRQPVPQAAVARGRAAGAGRGAPVATLEPDDLKRIKGVGPKLERLLRDNGIYTFGQLAALDKTEVRNLDKQLKVKGRIGRERWLEQARRLAEEKRGA